MIIVAIYKLIYLNSVSQDITDISLESYEGCLIQAQWDLFWECLDIVDVTIASDDGYIIQAHIHRMSEF